MQNPRLTQADLFGRPTISYLRFSSRPQEKGSSIDRQQETLSRVVEYYQLILDQTLIDRARSASKGDHRKHGKLGDLLKALKKKKIPRGTVLIVESIDRLTREGIFDVFKMLERIIRSGVILVTGDNTIWDEATINSDLNHKLVAEINAARSYAVRQSEMSKGAHESKRKKLANGEEPGINGKPSGWLVRDPVDKSKHSLHPVHAETVKRIYSLCADGKSVRQIARTLAADNVPLFDGMPSWTGTRIGGLLRDRHVLGMFESMRWIDGKRVVIQQEVKRYPAAVDAALWFRVREVLNSRKRLVGRRGKSVPNLFTGKVFCGTCGGRLRIDTGGGIRKGRRKRDLICAAYLENRTCIDSARYDMHKLERGILTYFIMLTELAPVEQKDASQFKKHAAELIIKIEQNAAAINALIPSIRDSPSLAETVRGLSLENDQYKRERVELELKAAAVVDDTDAVIRKRMELLTNLLPLVEAGDLDAREQIRTLLAPLDFRLEGHGDKLRLMHNGFRFDYFKDGWVNWLGGERIELLQAQLKPDGYRYLVETLRGKTAAPHSRD
ncbi:MAG: recombinase family protein [Rhodospirillales bacterium]|nr:recombinase family protein [Rhodospirillales bacterium]